ncbi:MAG: LamG domain-containing protein [Myxococcota bacterium]
MSGRLLQAALWLGMCGVGCTVDSLDLSTKNCPCLPPYCCNPSTNRCTLEPGQCQDAAVDAELSDADASDAAVIDGDPEPSRYAMAVLADEPVAYYRLNETNGMTIVDSSANGNDGTYVGPVTLGVAGAIRDDTAVLIEAPATQRMLFGDRFDWSGRAPFTLECWIMPDPMPSERLQRLFTKEEGNAMGRQGYTAFLDGTEPPFGVVLERWRDQMLPGRPMTDASTIDAGFTHIAIVYTGEQGIIYVNGIEFGRQISAADLLDTGGQFAVGDAYSGVIDEVAIYDKALESNRILEHVNAR